MALNQFPRRAFSGAATLQTFAGNGSTTTFTLSQAQFQNESFVFVDDVAQVPGVDFTINGTALTFTSAQQIVQKLSFVALVYLRH